MGYGENTKRNALLEERSEVWCVGGRLNRSVSVSTSAGQTAQAVSDFVWRKVEAGRQATFGRREEGLRFEYAFIKDLHAKGDRLVGGVVTYMMIGGTRRYSRF